MASKLIFPPSEITLKKKIKRSGYKSAPFLETPARVTPEVSIKWIISEIGVEKNLLTYCFHFNPAGLKKKAKKNIPRSFSPLFRLKTVPFLATTLKLGKLKKGREGVPPSR